MTISQNGDKTKILHIDKTTAEFYYCQELLAFFRRHPRARFSRLAVVHALNGCRSGVEGALSDLANKGILKKQIENNVTFYSMLDDKSI